MCFEHFFHEFYQKNMRYFSFYGQKRVNRVYFSKVLTGEIPVFTGPVDFLNRSGPVPALHQRVWVPRCCQSALVPTFFSFWKWCCTVWNLFISSKNPFLGIPLQNVKENDLILMESYPDLSKKERKRKHSDRLWNGSESLRFRWGMIMDLEESIS